MRHLTVLLCAAASLFAQTAPKFDAADVRRSGPGMNRYTLVSGGVLRGTRYDLRKATVLDMIRLAYGVDPDTVVGGPNWLEFDRFDIAAKAAAGSSPETVRLMLQALLADRFKLVLRHDTRPMPAFALTTGKSKPKLTESNGAANANCMFEQQPVGSPWIAVACRNMTMKEFAARLRNMAGDYLLQPVVDTTNLEGTWDFDLKWSRRTATPPAGSERITIFDAVEKQLGLALTRKDVPAPVLVVDRVNETPTPTAAGVEQQLPPRQVEFEVADLKPSRPGIRDEEKSIRVTPGGGVAIVGIPLTILMTMAWDIDFDHPERIANLPKGAESALFDVHAKTTTTMNGPVPAGTGFMEDDLRLMLRALLVERFGIKWHYEDRLVDAYSLARGKPKMQRGDPAQRASCKDAPSMAHDPRDVNPRLARLVQCRNVSMGQLASMLQIIEPYSFAYPVEDATGLGGGWDFTLSYTPEYMMQQTHPDADPSGDISVAEAISKQLGLKLEKRKRMLPVVVIDHMEEKPAEN
jgi:uncharacterized protein (TIGR03435 family)